MVNQELAKMIPNAELCYELLIWLEQAYDCSIAFWLSLEKHNGSGVDIWVLATGSGTIFDRLTIPARVPRSRVLQAQEGNIYPALWSCLLALESEFYRFQRPKLDRPFP
jgi:hypothetical protein